MARRADQDRIFIARRMAVRNRLTDEGTSLENAEAWCDAWEAEGERLGLERASPDFWRDGTTWIFEERKTRRTP